MSSNSPPSRVEIGIFVLEGGAVEFGGTHSWAWKQAFDRLLRDRSVVAGRAFLEFRHPEDYLDFVAGGSGLEGVKCFLASRNLVLPAGEPSDPPRMETLHGIINEARENYHFRLERSGAVVTEAALSRLRDLRKVGLKLVLLCRSRRSASLPPGVLRLFDVVVEGSESRETGTWAGLPEESLVEALRRAGVDPSKAFVVVGDISEAREARQAGFGLVVGVGSSQDREALFRAGAHLVLPGPAAIDLNQVQAWVENRAHVLPSAIHHWEDLRARYARKRAAVFLDYDGTLTPIMSRPDQAVLSPKAREVLKQVASRCPTAILSGRRREDVARLVGLPNISYAGSHGFDIVGPEGTDIRHQVGTAHLPGLGQAREELSAELAGRPGILIEDKRFSVAVHYRNVSPSERPGIETVVDKVAASHPGLRKSRGKLVFELKPDLEWDKGRALWWLQSKLGLDEPEVIPIYIGDDVTDEDAFRAVKGRGFGVLVATDPRPTQADFSLRDSDQVLAFLSKLSAAPSF